LQRSHHPDPSAQITNTNTVYSLQDFLASVNSIRHNIIKLTWNITHIGTLHQQALTDPDTSSNTALKSVITQTQILTTQIHNRIKSLELDAAKTPSADTDKKIKQDQVKTLKTGFQRELESYRQKEQAYQQQYRDQIVRQYRIVNPGASDAEVEEVRNVGLGNEGVFQMAVSLHPSLKTQVCQSTYLACCS